MNERIRELAIKAGAYEDGDTVLTGPMDVAKFAELIVEDCVAQVALIGISNFENEDIMWTVETAIDIIKSRFGKHSELNNEPTT